MEPIKLTASGVSENSLMVGEGEFFHIPVGALTLFEAVVYVNNVRAQVVDSRWQVKGPQIVGGTAAQNTQTGQGSIQQDPTINDGHGGRPESIATAWIGGNTVYSIQVDGGAYHGRQFVRFTIHAQVQIHCPSTKKFIANCSQCAFDQNKMQLPFGGRLEYITDDITVGGEIGILQMVSGYRTRMNVESGRQQIHGNQNRFIDIDEKLNLFYRSEIAKIAGLLAFEDTPEELCEDEINFNRYTVGYPPSVANPSYEQFMTAFAYKAPIRGATIESYIVTGKFWEWGWQMVAEYRLDEGGWGAETDFSDCFSQMYVQDWVLPEWRSNSIAQKDWRDGGV